MCSCSRFLLFCPLSSLSFICSLFLHFILCLLLFITRLSVIYLCLHSSPMLLSSFRLHSARAYWSFGAHGVKPTDLRSCVRISCRAQHSRLSHSEGTGF
jgi:hypothetical protein